MNGPLRKLIPQRLRQAPAALCLLAMAMQVSLPALHEAHHLAFHAAGAEAAVSLHAVADHGDPGSSHDRTSCPQCRLVSHLKTLSPLAKLAVMPTLRASWLVRDARQGAASESARESGAPRAPPLFV